MCIKNTPEDGNKSNSTETKLESGSAEGLREGEEDLPEEEDLSEEEDLPEEADVISVSDGSSEHEHDEAYSGMRRSRQRRGKGDLVFELTLYGKYIPYLINYIPFFKLCLFESEMIFWMHLII